MEQEPKTPHERAEDLIHHLVSDWRPTPKQVLWAIRIVFVFVIALGILTRVGRPFDITLWQWLDLLTNPRRASDRRIPVYSIGEPSRTVCGGAASPGRSVAGISGSDGATVARQG